MRTIIITEQQRRVILREMANEEMDKTIGENDHLMKRIAKQASDQINFDLSILATFSMSIGGLMGPVEQFLSGEYPTVSPMEKSLILAGIAFQYIIDNKKWRRLQYEKRCGSYENFPKNDYSYKQLFNFSKKIFKKKEKSFLDYCDYSFDFIKFMYDIKERRKLCDFLNTSITERSEKYLKHYIKCSETLTKCLK